MCEIEWGSVADWFSGTMAALAVIVALALARLGEVDAAKRDARQRRSSAEKTMMKLIIMLDNLKGIYLQLAVDGGLGDEPIPNRCLTVQGAAGLSNEGDLTFDADEYSVFLDAKEPQFALELSLLARRHATAVEVLKDYRRNRDQLFGMLPDAIDIEGLTVGFMMDSRTDIKTIAHAKALDAQLHDMTRHAETDLALVRKLCDQFGPICRKYFADPSFPGIGELKPAAKE